MADEPKTSSEKTQNGKRRTSATEKLTPAEALEILQQAAYNCQAKGIVVRAVHLYNASKPSIALVIEGVELVDGRLRQIANIGKGDAE